MHVIRCLNEGEKDVWLDFVSSVFQRTPRDYFQRHLENDPDSDIYSRIFVAVEDENKTIEDISDIMGTLRVFKRSLLYKSKSITFGGIGEVSVSSTHRRKGIATSLLQKAISVMNESSFYWSSLHTGEAAPLYKSVGYQPVTKFSSTISNFIISSDKNEYSCCTTSFSSDEINDMMDLYHSYSQHFIGCVERKSLYYWNHWVKAETPNIILVRNIDNELVAMIGCSIKDKNSIFVKEFAVIESMYTHDNGESIFKIAMNFWIHQFCSSFSEESIIIIPSPICSNWKSIESKITEIDNGVMYRNVSKQDDKTFSLDFDPNLHLFWPTDSY